MKLFDKFKHTGSTPVNQIPKDQKPVITSTIIETGETVEFSQEKLEKASQDLGEFKKTLEGKSDEEKSSLVKDFVSNHKDVSLALVALAGLQFGATTAQGFNHKEVMKSMENLEAKLDSKHLKELSDKHDSSDIRKYIADRHNVDKEMDKIQNLADSGRLYKSTPIKGLLKTAATITAAALWTIGPATAAILGIIEWGEIGDSGLGIAMGFGGAIGSAISNTFGWVNGNRYYGNYRDSMYRHLTKDGMQFNTPLGPLEAVNRLDKHKTVKIKQTSGNAKYDKINDISHVSLIK